VRSLDPEALDGQSPSKRILGQGRQSLRADGTPYTEIIRRRCRCLDCGQVQIDKEYL